MQVDQTFCHLLLEKAWQPVFSRSTDLADSIMTAIVLAPFAPSATLFVNLGSVASPGMRTWRSPPYRVNQMLCTHVEEVRETLRVDPGPLHWAEIETYGDHRIAMCFGMLGVRVPAKPRVRAQDLSQLLCQAR